jgi:hypothetical protein
MKKEQTFKVTSVSYVHNPDAAKEWFEVYVEMLLKKIEDKYVSNGS